jgi:glyoxylase-like metal-dependent hydrolase (beta-lactamase superfamily II)
MTCDVISTGSKGNAVVLNGKYLFDCGVPLGKLKPYLKHIRVVFLTHCHSDHFLRGTIGRIHHHRPSVLFACGRNLLDPLCEQCGVSPDNVILCEPGKIMRVNWGGESIEFLCFDLIHNVENVGWAVKVEQGEHSGTAMYATDTQYVPVDFPGLDLYMLESNHTVDELEKRRAAKIAAGEFAYEDTVRLSHMSAETVKEYLNRNAGPCSQVVFLHQHRKEAAENE